MRRETQWFPAAELRCYYDMKNHFPIILMTLNILLFGMVSYSDQLTNRTYFEFVFLIIIPVIFVILLRFQSSTSVKKLLTIIGFILGLVVAEIVGLSLRSPIIAPDGHMINQYGLRAIEFPLFLLLQLIVLPTLAFVLFREKPRSKPFQAALFLFLPFLVIVFFFISVLFVP